MFKNKIFGAIILVSMLVSLLSLTAVESFAASSEIISASGWLESAYVEWSPVNGADGYNVYIAS